MELTLAEKILLLREDLSETSKQIYYTILKVAGPLAEVILSPEEVADVLGVSEKTIRNSLTELENFHLIKKISPTKGRGNKLTVKIKDPSGNKLFKKIEFQLEEVSNRLSVLNLQHVTNIESENFENLQNGTLSDAPKEQPSKELELTLNRQKVADYTPSQDDFSTLNDACNKLVTTNSIIPLDASVKAPSQDSDNTPIPSCVDYIYTTYIINRNSINNGNQNGQVVEPQQNSGFSYEWDLPNFLSQKPIEYWAARDFVTFASICHRQTLGIPSLELNPDRGKGKILAIFNNGLVKRFNKEGLSKYDVVKYIEWLFLEKSKDFTISLKKMLEPKTQDEFLIALNNGSLPMLKAVVKPYKPKGKCLSLIGFDVNSNVCKYCSCFETCIRKGSEDKS